MDSIGRFLAHPVISHLLAICVFVLSVFLIARLLMEKRQPSNTFAWLLVIVLVPYLGVPLFLLLGGRKLKKLAARKSRLSSGAFSADGGARDDGLFSATMQAIGAAGGAAPSRGNSLTLLTSGEDAFAALESGIRAARHSIDMSTFILGRDETGRRIVQLLAERAGAGVRVRLLLDAVGCFFVGRRFVRPLLDAGGEVRWFMRVFSLPFRNTANLRNHRKIAVFDGNAAIAGGHNAAEEYMGAGPAEKRWRDFGCTISGPAVAQLEEVFFADWSFSGGKTAGKTERGAAPAEHVVAMEDSGSAEARAGILQVVASGPDVSGDPLYEGILSMIQEARKHICMITPYFIPDEVLWRSMIVKARAGVPVTLVVPARSNHPITDYARRNYLRELRKAGARVMFFHGGMMHSKALIVDGRAGLFGSANFDLRSLFVNFEIGVFVFSENEARAMQAWADAVVSGCEESRAEEKPRMPRLSALVEDCCRLLAPLL